MRKMLVGKVVEIFISSAQKSIVSEQKIADFMLERH